MTNNQNRIWIIGIALGLLLVAVIAALLVGGSLVQNTITPAPSHSDTSITDQQARQIALDHAGITAENATMIRVFKDREDGKLIYEVDFVSGDREFEYDIDALTGDVLSHSAESLFD